MSKLIYYNVTEASENDTFFQVVFMNLLNRTVNWQVHFLAKTLYLDVNPGNERVTKVHS